MEFEDIPPGHLAGGSSALHRKVSRKSRRQTLQGIKSAPETSRPSDVYRLGSRSDNRSHRHHHYRESKQVSESKNLRSSRNNSSPDPASGHPTRHDIAVALCKEYADELLDSALDVCHDRFLSEKGGEILAWELRDTWLDVITKQWMDEESSVFASKHSGTVFAPPDEPALPPKFDFWSNGALQTLPHSCRESIMDPFIRDKLPSWYFEKLVQTESRGADPMNLSRSPIIQLDTDKNPSHTLASLEDLKKNYELGQLREEIKNEFSDTKEDILKTSKKHSVEFVYPTKFHPPEIKGSTEMMYNSNGGITWKESSGNTLVAFNLPKKPSDFRK